jgi:hypothetical protein
VAVLAESLIEAHAHILDMPESGLFITLYDEDTLRLYLDQGIYGAHMAPEQEPGTRSKHFATLADFACAREDSHVFFFRKRHIVYGGQIVGSPNHGAFYINGPFSPIGKKIDAKLVWDESRRKRYAATNKAGIFRRPALPQGGEKQVCQPYLLLFKDKLGLKGRSIVSDKLYFELGRFPYPLPTNSISGMSFCTMAPAEVETALNLLRTNPERESFGIDSNEGISLLDDPIPFIPDYGISSLDKAATESELEAYSLAKPQLLPEGLRPALNTALCRQVPIAPFKPTQIDRADICFYNDDAIADGSIPNVVIELKNHPFGTSAEAEQIARYVKWLRKISRKRSNDIRVCVLARSFSDGWESKIEPDCVDQVEAFMFDKKLLGDD